MPFLTNSEQDIKEMLQTIGVGSFEDLISNIPADLRFNGRLQIPEAISEIEVAQLIEELGNKNQNGISFMGGGSYDHHIPAVVDTIIGRSEFYTAYTPYQPEVSQGTLQSIYEFQSMVSELTAMDVTNASMYEGGSALAEAMLLACGFTHRNKILVAGGVNRRYRQIMDTYILHNDIEIVSLPLDVFRLSPAALKPELDSRVAAVILQHPNYFGYLEEVYDLESLIHANGSLLLSYYDPISLGLIAPPGDYNADIAVAEGQVLGNRQNLGGPYVGLFSTKQDLIRKIPGRLSGKTTDLDGREGFVLTLQTREQHIRREKATSNICTNSGLMALAATVYLALMGRQGLRETAHLCLQKSHYLAEGLGGLKDVVVYDKAPFFKEFVVKFPVPVRKVLEALRSDGIFGGVPLKDHDDAELLLVAVTEKRTRAEMDRYVEIVRKIIG